MADTSSPIPAVPKSRGWLIAAGLLSIFVGFLAISFPIFFSIIITQLIGAFALVSGVIAFFAAIFGHHTTHRIGQALSGILRIAVGIALLAFALSGVATLTLLLAIVFVIEGVFSLAGAGSMKGQGGAGWLAFNGILALILGIMLILRWPSDAGWVIGLLYGINSLFSGTSLLMIGLALPKKSS